MPTIQFLSSDSAFMETLSKELARDLQSAGIADDLQVSQAKNLSLATEAITRGDPVSMSAILLAAAGTGGALTVLLGKDGFLSALARVLEKYIEGKQAQVIIETDDGKKIQLSGPIGEVKEILKDLKD